MTAPNTITVVGNLTADPQIRHVNNHVGNRAKEGTGDGVALTRLRLAVSRRVFVAESQTWEDRHDGYFDVVCWRELARNAGLSLRKGDRIIATGRLSRRTYDAKVEGGTQTRQIVEIEADDIGGSLRWYSWGRNLPRPAEEPTAETDAAHDDEGSEDEEDVEATDVVAPAA